MVPNTSSSHKRLAPIDERSSLMKRYDKKGFLMFCFIYGGPKRCSHFWKSSILYWRNSLQLGFICLSDSDRHVSFASGSFLVHHHFPSIAQWFVMCLIQAPWPWITVATRKLKFVMILSKISWGTPPDLLLNVILQYINSLGSVSTDPAV